MYQELSVCIVMRHSFKLFDVVLYRQVNKVITGSVADRDGRIKKGDRVISINGRSMKNTTHREALNTLKVRSVWCHSTVD